MPHGNLYTEEDDPNRCQAVTKAGQCPSKSEPESNYCSAHGGIKAAQSVERQNIRNYQVAKWQAKIQRHSSSENVKSLREEIGILRMTLEERLNSIENTTDLLLQSAAISDLVMKIEKVVSSCHKLEGSMGELLDKQALLQFAQSVINIIGTEIEDKEAVDRVANKILKELGTDE